MEGSGVVDGVKKELLRRSSTEPIKVVTVLDTAVSTNCLTMASRAANGLDVDTLGVVTVDTELTTVVAALEAVVVVAVEAALLPTGVDDGTKELGLETDGLVLVLDVTGGEDPEPTAGGACVAITSDSRALSKSAEKEFLLCYFPGYSYFKAVMSTCFIAHGI